VKRKPGRPKLPKGEAGQFTAAATKNNRTLSEWIRNAVLALEYLCFFRQ